MPELFSIVGQYVKSLSFDNTRFSPNQSITISDDLFVDWSVLTKKFNNNVFESSSSLECYALLDSSDGSLCHKLFSISMVYSAIVAINMSDIEQETLGHILCVDVPNLIFPFVRKIVADITCDGGYNSIYLSSIDFESIYNKQADYRC